MRPIKSLKGKRIAIVGLGNSQIDYIIGRENSVEWDEVWGINAYQLAQFYDWLLTNETELITWV